MPGVVVGGALVWSVLWFTRLGFNPTDDGLILAQAQRLWGGEVPHADFATPRPAGAAILHLLDIGLPGPQLMISRIVVLAQLVVTAAMIVRLITGRPFRVWEGREGAVVAAGFVVSLHTFPLMSWHTVDGVLLAVVSLWLIEVGARRGSLVWLSSGAFFAGFAPLVKQSFAAVPVLAVLWFIWAVRSTPVAQRPGYRAISAAAGALVLPGFCYLIWVAGAGGFFAAVDQMTAAESVDVFSMAQGLPSSGLIIVVMLAATVPAMGLGLLRRHPAGADGSLANRFEPWTRVAQVVSGALILAMAAAVTLAGGLGLGGEWGMHLWWLAVVAASTWSVVAGRVDAASAAVLAVGWMASLSWGYPVPNLVAGGFVVIVLLRSGALIGLGVGDQGRAVLAATASGGALALALVLLVWSVPLRRDHVYRDVAAWAQTGSLSGVAPSVVGVRTNEVTAAYMAKISECLELHPASALAVLPDNPGVPMLLDRRNPLPVDWWYPPELPGDRVGLIERVDRVDDAGDYLILFQTAPVDGIASQGGITDATPTSPLFDYSGGMAQLVFDSLDGEVITCGPFVGRYRPDFAAVDG